MSGIFPESGVPASQAAQAQINPNVEDGCDPLYHSSTRCNPRFDPAAANAVISEIVNLVNCADMPYDCTKLDNLCIAVTSLIDKRIAELPPVGISANALGQTVFTDPQTITPNLQLKEQTTPSPLISISGGAIQVEPGHYSMAAGASVFFTSNAAPSNIVPYYIKVTIRINGVAVQSATGHLTSRVGFTGNGSPTASIAPVIRRINPGDLITMDVTANTDNSGQSTLIRLNPEDTYITLTKLKD